MSLPKHPDRRPVVVTGHCRDKDLPSTVWPPPVERADYVTQEMHQ